MGLSCGHVIGSSISSQAIFCWAHGLSSWGTQTQSLRHSGLVALWYVGSSWTRDYVPRTGDSLLLDHQESSETFLYLKNLPVNRGWERGIMDNNVILWKLWNSNGANSSLLIFILNITYLCVHRHGLFNMSLTGVLYHEYLALMMQRMISKGLIRFLPYCYLSHGNTHIHTQQMASYGMVIIYFSLGGSGSSRDSTLYLHVE